MVKEKSKNIFEDSREGTIGARIKVLLLRYDNNVSALEEAGKVGNGTLKTWKDKALDFSTTIVSNFRKELRINPEWWETGKGVIYLGKGTDDDKPSYNYKNGDMNESVYKTIVEGHTEYMLIPRSILSETQLVSTEQIKRTWEELAQKNNELAEKNKELENKNKQIDFYQGQFARLMENLELTPKPPDSKEIKNKG